MPTGYTAAVQSGEIISLKDFAYRCARGMGALIMMRDEPWDAPIPERFEPSDYNAKKLAEAQANLDALWAMTPEECQSAADAEHAAREEQHAAWQQSRKVERERYEAMIAKVKAWVGAPEGIKSFMLSQLHESMAFDCPENATYWYSLDAQTGAEWKAERAATLLKDRAYHEKANQEEIERTEGRNAWIAQLRESLEGGAA